MLLFIGDVVGNSHTGLPSEILNTDVSKALSIRRYHLYQNVA